MIKTLSEYCTMAYDDNQQRVDDMPTPSGPEVEYGRQPDCGYVRNCHHVKAANHTYSDGIRDAIAVVEAAIFEIPDTESDDGVFRMRQVCGACDILPALRTKLEGK